jgi:hypothetical protein
MVFADSWGYGVKAVTLDRIKDHSIIMSSQLGVTSHQSWLSNQPRLRKLPEKWKTVRLMWPTAVIDGGTAELKLVT